MHLIMFIHLAILTKVIHLAIHSAILTKFKATQDVVAGINILISLQDTNYTTLNSRTEIISRCIHDRTCFLDEKLDQGMII